MKKHNLNYRQQDLRYRWWIVLLIALIYLVPKAIDYLYFRGLNNTPNTFFSAGDLLLYCGSLLTIVGVYITIQYSQKNYREDITRRVMPYIVIQNVKPAINKFADKALKDNSIIDLPQEFSDGQIERTYLFIWPDSFEFVCMLDKYKCSNIKHADNNEYYTLDLINVGLGTAVNLMINVSETPNQQSVSPTGMSILPGQKTVMGIYVDRHNAKSIDKDTVEFYLKASYSTIYDQKYIQIWKLTVIYKLNEAYEGIIISSLGRWQGRDKGSSMLE